MNPGPSWSVPVVRQPPSFSRANPVVGVVPQDRSTGPPQWPKSTPTITPVVVVHPLSGLAAAAAGPLSAPVSTVRIVTGREPAATPARRALRAARPAELMSRPGFWAGLAPARRAPGAPGACDRAA